MDQQNFDFIISCLESKYDSILGEDRIKIDSDGNKEYDWSTLTNEDHANILKIDTSILQLYKMKLIESQKEIKRLKKRKP